MCYYAQIILLNLCPKFRFHTPFKLIDYLERTPIEHTIDRLSVAL